MANKKSGVSIMRRLHRKLGASAAAFILFMAFSGLAINHTQGLGLDRHHVTQSFLLGWYGIGEPEQIRSFSADGNWLSFAGSQAYFNGNYVSTLSNGVGAIFDGDMLVVAGSNELLILDREGGLVERLPWEHPDSGMIESIGLLENGTVLVKSTGKLWMTDAQLLQWKAIDEATVTPAWSDLAIEPEEIRQNITRHYLGAGLSMEQLLLDLHSGHIFGPVGMWVYDLLALIVGFLAISGIVLWIRGNGNGKKKYSKF